MAVGRTVQPGIAFETLLACVLSSGAAQSKYSFEVGDFAGWTVQGEAWSIYTKAASDGEKSAMCSISKGDAPGLKACARPVEKADAGWVVNAKLDICGKAKSNSSKATVVLMCVDEKGGTIREVKKEILVPASKFENVSLPEIVVPSGTVETYLMLVVEVTKPAGANEWWRFDNVVIEVK